jgi:Predicted glycosyltransferases
MFKFFSDLDVASSINSQNIIIENKKTFSIITPCFKSNARWLLKTIQSVQNQSYPYWQFCLGLCEISNELKDKIFSICSNDPRILIIELHQNRGIAENSNSIALHATGDYIGFLDHDDILHKDALSHMHKTLCEKDYDLIYSDEEIFSDTNPRTARPFFKPNWALDSFLSYNYFCHFTIIKMSLFKKLDGFNSEFEGAQDYDLFLRITELTNSIGHIPRILYSWRSCVGSSAQDVVEYKPYAIPAGISAVNKHLSRQRISALALPTTSPGIIRVKYDVKNLPVIEIIIISINKPTSLVNCLQSILTKNFKFSIYFRIVLPANRAHEEILSNILNDERIRFVIDENPFNFSRIYNSIGLASTADILIFLSDSVRVIDHFWLENLIEHAQRDEIGAVGTMLYSKSGKIQRSWFTLNSRSIFVEFNSHLQLGNYANSIQNVSAISSECLCTRQKLFKELEGFSINLGYKYFDIDYCLRLIQKGLKIVYTPYAAGLVIKPFLNFSKLQPASHSKLLSNESNIMIQKWGQYLHNDLYFNFNYFDKQPFIKLNFKSLRFALNAHLQYLKMIKSFIGELS